MVPILGYLILLFKVNFTHRGTVTFCWLFITAFTYCVNKIDLPAIKHCKTVNNSYFAVYNYL